MKLRPIGVLLMVLALASHCSIRAAGDVDPAALDSRKFGYPAAKPRFEHAVHLTFLDAQQLAITFPIRNPESGLVARSDPFRGAYLSKTIFFDISTSTVLAERTWGSFSFTTILALDGNQFLLRSGYHIQLYSKTLALIAERDLSYQDLVTIHASVTGKTLYVVRSTTRGDEVERWEVPSLSTIATLPIEGSRFFTPAATDDALWFTTGSEPPHLAKQEFGKQRIIVTPQPALDCFGPPVPISESRFVISGGCHSLTVIDSNGSVLHKMSLGKEVLGRVFAARDSEGFCTETHISAGGSMALDVPKNIADVRLECFDSLSFQRFSSLSLPPRYEALSSLAISPDGRHAAFCQDGKVFVMHLERDSDHDATQ